MAAAIGSVNSLMQAHPMSTTPAANGNSADEGSSISANDFLTLLVTEMKNQDPTAQTDPNEYINQLVQVNSLQQLIQINETLSGAMSSSGGSGSGPAPDATSAASTAPYAAVQTAGSGNAKPGIPAHYTSGNLSVPGENPAAHRVAQALSGRH